MKRIILFDGVCHFCNRSVQFIIKRDKRNIFQFASLQGELGQQLLKKHKIDPNIDSLVLIENEKYYLKSAAALKICQQLSWPWPLFYVFILIPVPIRNLCYDFIAKNRYRIFKSEMACPIPSAEIRKKFLD